MNYRKLLQNNAKRKIEELENELAHLRNELERNELERNLEDSPESRHWSNREKERTHRTFHLFFVSKKCQQKSNGTK